MVVASILYLLCFPAMSGATLGMWYIYRSLPASWPLVFTYPTLTACRSLGQRAGGAGGHLRRPRLREAIGAEAPGGAAPLPPYHTYLNMFGVQQSSQ